MRRVALGLLLVSLAIPARAQVPSYPSGAENQSNLSLIAPTAPTSDNGNRIATTAWVNLFAAGSIPLQSGKIFIGSGGNLAVGQTPSGDCTLSLTGVVTCTQAAGNFQVIGNLTVGGSIIDGNGILFTNIVAPATPSAGTTRGYVDSTTKRFSDKNDAGTVGNTVVASLAVANQFMTGISAAGVITRAQPAVTDISGFGTGVATFLATPTTANLAAAVTGETGTGALVFGTSPAITTPTGIVKGDVGLGNVANVDTTNATNISSGTLAPARLSPLLTTATNSLGADVAMATNAYFTGPSMAQGTSGTWYASGNVTLIDGTALATFNCKLWDAPTVIDSGSLTTQSAGLSQVMHLSGILAAPAANIRISCADTNGTPNGVMKFNLSGNSKDSTISGIRIQ